MKDINGNTLYLRKAEENVLNAFLNGNRGERKVTVRDTVVIRLDSSAYYRLWNTKLVERSTDGSIRVYITDNSDMDYVYYRNYGRRRDPAMTQTTKGRLDAFLRYYGFNTLEVHSSKKLFGVWHNGKELENNTWYELDFTSRELVKID